MDNQTEVKITFKNYVNGEKKLERYRETLSKVNSILSGMDKGMINDLSKSAESIKNIDKETKNIGKNVNNAFKYGAIREFTRHAKNLTQEFSALTKSSFDYLENLNLYQVAFDGNTKSADKFINTMTEMYGLDESWLVRNVGIFKQLSNAMGVSVETGNKLSQLLTQMSLDISSLYNVDIERASSVLQSSLAGQTKPIRGLTGGDITQATLQTTLDNLGINRAITDLSFAEKRLLIVISLTDQLSESIGDMGRTIESPSNQMRILNEQWERFNRAVGNVFLPILEEMLPYLNAILMVLTEIINMVATLFGYNEEDYNFLGDTSDSAFELEEGLSGAVASAEKLKRGLRGFDKLNVITTPSSSGASAGAGSGIDPDIMNAFNKAFDEYQSKLDNVEMKANRIRDAIMGWLGFTKVINPLTEEISWKYEGIKTTLSNLYDGWKKLNTVGKVFVALGIVATLKNIYNLSKNLLTKVFNGGLLKSTSGLATYFLKLYKNTGMFNQSLKATIKDNKELVTGLNGLKMGLMGVLTTLTGLSLVSENVKSIKENGANLINILGLVGGGISTVIGTISILIPLLTTLGVTFTATWAAATAGISLIIVAITALVASLSEADKETVNYKKSMDDLTKSADASYQAGLTTIKHTQDLVSELKTLVDENGRVKKSDEARVNYILTKVKETYGIELSLIDGKILKNGEEIQSNGDLIKSIDEVMKKKRSEAFLNAYQDVYNQALIQQNEILKEAETLNATKGELSKKQKKRLEELKEQYDKNSKTIKEYEELEMAYYEGNIEKMEELNQEFFDDSTIAYNKAFNRLKEISDKTKESITRKFGNLNFNAKLDLDTSNATNKFNNFGYGLQNSGLGFSFKPLTPGQYANGGLPPVGQLFVANERGPELVGHIGGQSFVANQNQMMDLLDKKIGNNNGGTKVINIYLDEYHKLGTYTLEQLEDMAKSNGEPITIG